MLALDGCALAVLMLISAQPPPPLIFIFVLQFLRARALDASTYLASKSQSGIDRRVRDIGSADAESGRARVLQLEADSGTGGEAGGSCCSCT